MTTNSKAVFLSYASEDAAAAHRIAEALRSAGVEVWFDQDELRGGDAWDQKIRRQIRECALFMPIVSENTQARPEGYFRLEWKLAVDRSHLMADDQPFLLPVVIDVALDESARVPDRFRLVQWTSLPDGITSGSFTNHVLSLLTAGIPPKSAPFQPPPAVIPRPAGSRKARLAVGLAAVILVVAVSYLSIDKFVLARRPSTEKTPAVQALAPPTHAIPEKSVAVLPFVDMSEKHDQEYFADGLTEELIDRLSQSSDLKVIARTSSFHYKGRNDDVRTIALALGVRHLLEGSVRKSGKHLRVTVQLLRASDGSHIWSDTYDQLIQDVFKIQTDIANAVTRRLNASMAALAQSDRDRPTVFAAYEMVLQGDTHRRFNKNDIDAAIDCYRRAVALDPGYALAWARFGRELVIKQQMVDYKEAADLQVEAEQAVTRALEIDPNLAFGYYARGWVVKQKADFKGAEEAFRHANLLQPGIADRMLANIKLLQTGDLSAAIDTYRALLDRDPKFPTLYARLGDLLFHAGRFAEAETVLRQLIALEPGFGGARWFLIRTLVSAGSASKALEEMALEDDPDNLPVEKVLVYWVLGRREESTAALKLIPRDPNNLETIAELHAFRGEIDQAFRDLDDGFNAGPQYVTELNFDRYFEKLRSDPRYALLLRKMDRPN
jgi:TolB-like protein